MRVVILGSGVVGVASAWYLNQAGHEVTVIDREPGAATETSAANAGQISPDMLHRGRHGVPLKRLNGCSSAMRRWRFVSTVRSSS